MWAIKRGRSVGYGVLIVLLVGAAAICGPVGASHGSVSTAKARAPNFPVRPLNLRPALTHLPLTFEANIGQTDPRALYLARGPGFTLFLTRSGAVVSMAEASTRADRSPLANPAAARGAPPRHLRRAAIRIAFAGARRAAEIVGLDPLRGRVSYFIGNDPRHWHTDVPAFGRIRYRGVYRGIDLVFFGNRDALECDFVVAPGANSDAIRLSVEGGVTRIDHRGDLIIGAGRSKLVLKEPAVYQTGEDGKRQTIESRYLISHGRKGSANTVRIALASYDRTRPLVIDPQLVFSTYLGGSFFQLATGIAVDAKGLVYLTGVTSSGDFPTTTNAFQSSSSFDAQESVPGELDTQVVFVAILDPTAGASAQLVYSSFIGGANGAQQGNSIAVDSKGDVYVAGVTFAFDFPSTADAFQRGAYGGPFVTVLNPAVTGDAQLVYSSYLGSANDSANAIAVANGLIYVTGATASNTFPAFSDKFPSQPFQSVNKAFPNGSNAFVSIFDPGSKGPGSLIYSTYLGGKFSDAGNGIAVSTSGNVYVTGMTSSPDFPLTSNAFQGKLKRNMSSHSGYATNAFVSVLNPLPIFVPTKKQKRFNPADELVYSTFLGGSGNDQGNAIAAAPDGTAYVAGFASSHDFPVTSGSLQTRNTSSSEQFSFAVTQSLHPSQPNPNTTAFFSRLDPTKKGRASLVYSTYLGGTGAEDASGVVLGPSGRAYLTGSTFSLDFPTTKGAFETLVQGNENPFLSENAFLSVIDPAAKGARALVYSSYLGGFSGDTHGQAVAVDSSGIAYVAGLTRSANFPTTAGAFQPTGQIDPSVESSAFIAALDPAQALTTASASLQSRPAALTFPSEVVIGGKALTSSPQTLTFSMSKRGRSNTSSVVAIEGIASAGDFAIDSSASTCALGLSLTLGSTCTVAVTFRPTAVGVRSGLLTIADNAANGPQRIKLKGIGVGGLLEVSPLHLDFGNQPVGIESAASVITLTNNNPVGISISRFFELSNRQFVTGGKLAFSQCESSLLTPGGSCQISVTFIPATVGKQNGSLQIFDDAANSPQKVMLSGTGVKAAPTATATRTMMMP
jgi:Beta-propeller repeat